MKRSVFLITLISLLAGLSACNRQAATPPPPTLSRSPASGQPSSVAEVSVVAIPLAGPLSRPEAEISGMAWYSDTLILLPQYPNRFDDTEDAIQSDGAVFALAKEDILAFLEGESATPLTPRAIPLIAAHIQERRDYQGFEAIAFAGNQAFLTVETGAGSHMMGYLASGILAPDLSSLTLADPRWSEIPPQATLDNMSDEALLVAGQRIVTLYEANGPAVNPHPVAHLFDLEKRPQGTIPFPNIEYRITDATPPDETGRFWAINYFYPGDTKLKPGTDPLAARYGEGPTHAQNVTVERLVEFQFTEDGIALTDTPPLQLSLLGGDQARNWEALARLESNGKRGFLIATDKFPETILAYVPYLP